MKADLMCYYCCMNKAEKLLDQFHVKASKKLEIMKKIFYSMGNGKMSDSAPVIMAKAMRILEKEAEMIDIYDKVKAEYNQLLLSKETQILESIRSSEDQLLTALQYAMIGNYIDFGAMDTVDSKKLEEMLKDFSSIEINAEELRVFRKELEGAGELIYITDNAGEIVLDKLCIQILQELYPYVNIHVIVRGAPALNDATIKDAKEIGLTDIVEVIPNGTDIAGTELDEIGDRAKEMIEKADMIISKGQGNFETLSGCNLNIYYVFLCKCDMFTSLFNMPRFKGIFANEKNIMSSVMKASFKNCPDELDLS